MKIINRKIGAKYDPLIIAEIGINHNGDLEIAKQMVDSAKRAGVEIIKHQTHIVDDEMSPEAKKIKEQTGEGISNNTSLFEMLKRPKVLHSHLPQGDETLAPNAVDEIEASVKYEGYIKRQKIDIERLQRNENTPIPGHIDYEKVVGLSNEVKQKLSEARPESLARASRLS